MTKQGISEAVTHPYNGIKKKSQETPINFKSQESINKYKSSIMK